MVAVAIPVAFLYLPRYSAFAFIAVENILKQWIMLVIFRRAVAMHDVLTSHE